MQIRRKQDSEAYEIVVDNQEAIQIACDSLFHERTMDDQANCSTICEKINRGFLSRDTCN